MRTEQSGLPCAMALRLIPRSPRGPGFIAPVAARSQVSRNLTPASGRQDHTALPLRDSFARLATLSRPPHLRSNVRDDREAPLVRAGMAENNHSFLENGRDIFALTFRRCFVIERADEFPLCVEAIVPLPGHAGAGSPRENGPVGRISCGTAMLQNVPHGGKLGVVSGPGPSAVPATQR